MKVPKRKKRPAIIVLVSMIDMFTILIIYLLTQASTKVVGTLSELRSEAPIESQDEPPPPDPNQHPPLNLSLFIQKDGFLVSAENEIVLHGEAEMTSDRSLQISKTVTSEYDYTKLNRALAAIKKQYPKEKQVIITSDPEIPYEVLVGVMDAARETNVLKDGKLEILELFPKPTIAAGVM